MNDIKENVNILLSGKEIEPDGLYDFSFRKVPTSKVPLYRGLAGQLTVNPDDKYRLQAWYGDELGHNEQVVLQSDLQGGTTEFSLAFKNASVAVLSKEIDNTTLTLDAQEYGIAVLDVSNSNTISLEVPSKAGTKLQLIIKNLTDDAKLTFKSEKEINWSGSAANLPTELNKFYSVIFTYTGVYWEAEQNTSTIHAEHAKKADEAETAYKMAKLVVKLTGAATGSGVMTDDDELTVNVEKIDLLNVLEINAEIPKVNKNHIYLDTVNSHFWVFDYTTTFKWLDLFTVLNTQLAAFDLRLIDLEKLSIGDNLTYLRNHMDNAEANIIQNQQDIDKLEDRASVLEDRATSLETRADANDTTNANFETRISTNTTDISNLDSRVTANEGNIKTNTDNISSIDIRVTAAEGNITKLDQRVNNIETSTDAGALATKLTSMETTIATHGTNIQANTYAISTEASDRAAADTTLEGKVSDEVTARTNADAALETKISDEAKAREDADTALAESVKNDIQPKLDALSEDVSKNYLQLSGGTMVTEGTTKLQYSLSDSATATREGDYYTFSLADGDSVAFAPSSGNVVLGNVALTKATTSFNFRIYDSMGWRWYALVTPDDTTAALTADLSNLSNWTRSAYQPNHTDETEEKPTIPQLINNEVEEIILVKDTDTKTTESITVSIDFCNCKETTETISEEWSAKRIKEFSNKLDNTSSIVDSSISELKSNINTKIDEFTTSITNQLNTQNTDVSDKLATVVTLSDTQTITGAKDFTGGLTATSPDSSASGTEVVTAEWVRANKKQGGDADYVASLTASDDFFRRPSLFECDKRSVTLPAKLEVKINGTIYKTTETHTISISDFGTQAGKDFYIYACVPTDTDSIEPDFVISQNSTVPTDYTAENSRKIGGFHTLCASVGTLKNVDPLIKSSTSVAHKLSGYVTGDILPASRWDLWHRPKVSPEGYVYCGGNGCDVWVSIYLLSWDGSKLVSKYNAVTADGGSSKVWHGELFSDAMQAIGGRLPYRREFARFAFGSNEATNIYDSADKTYTGGHTDTSSRRMISDIGCEDCCGYLWQWSEELGFCGGSGWSASTYSSSVDPISRGNSYGGLYRLELGGDWNNSSSCGSRSANGNNVSSNVDAYRGGRGASEPMHRDALTVTGYPV